MVLSDSGKVLRVCDWAAPAKSVTAERMARQNVVRFTKASILR